MIPYLPLQRINAMYDSELKDAAAAVIDSGRYLRGEQVAAFEYEYARYIGTPHCIGVGNGYDALWFILRGYRVLGLLQEGDEVLVSAHTFIATVAAIVDNGLTPVFIDVCEDTLQLDDNQIEQAVTPHTRAIMLVHLYGKCAYTEHIEQFCSQHGLLLIEDNAQAQGCIYKEEKRTGSIGNAAAHSFYPGKNLGALGDSGAVTTHDDKLAAVIRAIANYGMTEKNVCRHAGRNSRMDELQAAMLRVKLRHLDEDNGRRREIARRYLDEMDNFCLRMPAYDDTNVYHIFPILCTERARLQQHLADHGVETLIHYPIPPHCQACYPQWHGVGLPVTERICGEELSLPCHQAMTEEEVNKVVAAVNSFTR